MPGASIVADSTAGIAVISLAFIVGGYLLLAWLFYVIVYRPSRRGRADSQAEGDETADRPSHRPGVP